MTLKIQKENVMSHPRQNEARRLGDNDEGEMAKTPRAAGYPRASKEAGKQSEDTGDPEGKERVHSKR